MDPNVPVLLMDVSGAVGLNLHFVSHVFLMDPIPDVSLEEQIIARAWRMGAKETVRIPSSEGSVEHTLMKLRNFGSLDETIVDENASGAEEVRFHLKQIPNTYFEHETGAYKH